MSSNPKVVPSSPNSSSISSSTVQEDKSLEGIALRPFKLKPKGAGATINTLVENDSLSSYSLPEEIKRPNGAKPQTGAKASHGASRDSSENEQSSTTTLSPKRHTVIDIDQLAEPAQEPTYVEAYMKVMYWTCLSPYNPSRSCHGESSWCAVVLKIIQKIWKASRMLTGLNKLRAYRIPACHSNSNKNSSTMSYAVKLGLSSIAMTFIQTVLYSGVWKWTPRKSILGHSRVTAFGLYLWSEENLGNFTWVDNLKREYGKETTETTLLLGAFGVITHFCGYLHNEATGDMMQMLAETVREEMQCLQNRIKRTENDEENTTLSGFFRENGEWAHSRILTQTLNCCNDTLDLMMKLKHVDNLMLYVFFVLNVLDWEYSLAFLAYLLYGICKSSYMYRIAAEASSLNASKREWIRRLAWKSKDENFLKKVPLLKEEIKDNPTGMGKGQFLINDSFIYKFLGWVGSIFVLQAQSREAFQD